VLADSESREQLRLAAIPTGMHRMIERRGVVRASGEDVLTTRVHLPVASAGRGAALRDVTDAAFTCEKPCKSYNLPSIAHRSGRDLSSSDVRTSFEPFGASSGLSGTHIHHG
jgi:hypothetical protein